MVEWLVQRVVLVLLALAWQVVFVLVVLDQVFAVDPYYPLLFIRTL